MSAELRNPPPRLSMPNSSASFETDRRVRRSSSGDVALGAVATTSTRFDSEAYGRTPPRVDTAQTTKIERWVTGTAAASPPNAWPASGTRRYHASAHARRAGQV